MPTRKIAIAAALLFLLSFSFAIAETYEMKEDIAWFDDYTTALKRAEKDNKLLVVTFYTSWCVFCKKMDKETFTDPRIVELSKSFVFAKLDADLQKAASMRYKPEGFPTIIFASPSGNEILRISGYRDAEQFLRVLQTINDYGVGFTEYLTRAEKNPKDLLAQEMLGHIYLNIGIYDKAKFHLGKALKVLPSYQESSSGISPGDPLSSSAKIPGDSHETRILFLLSQASLAEKDYSRASKTLQELIEKNPQSTHIPVYYLELGRVYIAWGKQEKARDTFLTLNKLYPDSPQAETAKALIK